MKKLSLFLITTAAMTWGVSAQTAFTNADGANDYISNALNWDNGLPGAGNDGTIAINAGVDTDVVHTNYGNVNHSAGQINRTNGLSGLRIGTGTFWTMSGSATATGLRGISIDSGGTFTLNLANNTDQADFTNNNRDVNTSGTLTINSGVLQTGRSFTTRNGTINMNGGSITFSAAGNFGTQALTGSSSFININAGNVTAERFSLKSGTEVVFGTTGAGLLDFDDWGSGLYSGSGDRAQDSGIDINVLSGSQIVLDLSAAARGLDFTNDSTANPYSAAWAQALWETDRLYYNDQNSTDLGGLSWADATNSSIGLGSGEYWDFTVAGTYGGVLSLAAIPEPSTFMLLMVGLGGLLFSRRSRS